jgi:SAM-dependent methyltransferase
MKDLIRSFLFFFVLFIYLDNSYPQDVPFVPTPYAVVEGMLELAEVDSNDIVYDLGCGDGRIVVVAAKKYGATGVGVDSNPERIKESNENAKENDVTDKVEFREQNLFETDLSRASVVTIYLLSDVNIELRPKLFRELKPGTRLVSNSFDMDEWEPEERRVVGQRNIYLWKMPENFSGKWDGTSSGNNSENVELRLNQLFQKIDGTLKVGKDQYKLSEIKHNGKELQFTFNRNNSDKNSEVRFEGTLNGNELSGIFNSYNGQSVNKEKITLERDPNSIIPLDPSLKQTEAAGK